VTATRRLAAVHAVDIVGYSRLIDEDEAGQLPHQPQKWYTLVQLPARMECRRSVGATTAPVWAFAYTRHTNVRCDLARIMRGRLANVA
jgi:hypothetical protein